MNHVNDREPNFHSDDGQLFLVRCFACGGARGTENWGCAVATGQCSFCGWLPPSPPSTRDQDDALEDKVKRKRDDQLRRIFG